MFEVGLLNLPASDAIPVSARTIPKETGLAITVVICTRNRPEQLSNCLKAVGALKPSPGEVLIVDNSDGDPETESVARRFSARYVVETALGLSHARNRGLMESNTEIVAYLDDDATPDEHWLEFIFAPFNDPKVAAVTGETILPGTSPGALAQEPLRTLTNQDPLWFEIATFGGLGVGNNMAIRKAACPQGKIFDARLGRGALIHIAEESHAFASLLTHGYKAVHVPAAIMIHHDTPEDIEHRASSSVAYWLFLFSEFPRHRGDLLRFLFRRLRKQPLPWPRNPQPPGELINSGWRVYLKAGFHGSLLFLRSRKFVGK
jgi:glycosyltransferase involved in cell wall biosynthesis